MVSYSPTPVIGKAREAWFFPIMVWGRDGVSHLVFEHLISRDFQAKNYYSALHYEEENRIVGIDTDLYGWVSHVINYTGPGRMCRMRDKARMMRIVASLE